MQMPTEDGLATAGRTFEYVAPERRAKSPQCTGKKVHRVTLAINTNKDKNIPADSAVCYETLASQEEIYLEETRKKYARF
jgi:hypothetical protein